jgi:hypothetical protein
MVLGTPLCYKFQSRFIFFCLNVIDRCSGKVLSYFIFRIARKGKY